MARRLTGAALTARVVANLRAELSEDYGLPMAEYALDYVDKCSIGSDMQPIMAVTFKRANGRTIQVYSIYPADNGDIYQRSADIEFR